MSTSKILIRNALSNYAGFFISALVSLFVSPFIVHHIGNTGYGLWALFQSVFGYFGLLDLGIGVAVIKYISQFKAKEDQRSINVFGSTMFYTYMVIGSIALMLSLFLAPLIPYIFNIPAAYKHIAVYAVLISGLTTAIMFPMGFLVNSLSAHQRYDLTNAIGIIRSLIYAAMVVLLLKHGFGLLSLFMLNLILSILTMLISLYLVAAKYKLINIRLHMFNVDMLKMAYKYSIFAFLNNIAGQINSSIGNILIGTIISVGFVTYYALALKINMVIVQAISAIVGITLPVFSELWAVNDMAKTRFTYLEVGRAIALISLPVYLVIILYGESIMNLWIGSGYHLAALCIILIAVFMFIHNVAGYITGILLFGIGRHRTLSIANATGTIANVVLAVVLTKWIAIRYGAGYGILGIPIALLLTLGAVDIFFLPWYVNKIIELPHKEYVKTFIRPVLFIIPAVAVALLIKHYYEPHVLIVFVLESAVIGFFYWGLYYLFGLTGDERARYAGYLKQLVGKV